ncbi:MAG: S8 family peptidase, partial [Rhodothalassiaceae bacterium]
MTQAHPLRFLQRLLVAIMVAMLAACGGSGGTPPATSPPPPPSAPPPPPPPPPSGFDTQEFDDSNGLDNINAKPAFELGGDGAGVVVGIVDSGIDADHIEFRGRISPASKDVTLDRSTPTIEDEDGHGTLVAGIIGANRNNLGIMGVAFNATLLIARADSPKSCSNDKDGCSFAERDIAAGIRLALDNGARVVNLSLGGDGFGPGFLNAVREAAAADVLVVIAAGNDSTVDPSGFAQVALDPLVQGHVLVVGATTQFDTLAGFSDKAGVLQDVFLVAPGQSVRSTFINNQLALASGTSFAAPFVTGAVAVMAQMFPNLTGLEIAEILLSTARDLGDPGPDPVFGQGLLDLGRAVQPIGTAAVPTRADASTSAPVTGAAAATGAAFGDAIARSDVFDGILMIDRYRRSYRVDLGARIVAAPAGLGLVRLIDRSHRLPGVDLAFGAGSRLSLAAYEDKRNALTPLLSSYLQARTEPARPTAFFTGRLDARSGISLAYGFAPARLLATARGADPAQDFALSERIDTPFLAPADAGEALLLTRRLSPRWTLSAALARNEDRDAGRFAFPGLEPMRTASTTAVGEIAGRLGRGALGLQIGSRREQGSV